MEGERDLRSSDSGILKVQAIVDSFTVTLQY